MSIKHTVKATKEKLLAKVRNLKNGIAQRWRSLSPGFRYALVYFVCVVCIASLVWWQYNPGSGLVFDPEEPSAQGSEDQEAADPDKESEDDEDSQAGRDWTVFLPQKGDKLSEPLSGDVLTAFGQPFAYLGMYNGGIDGVHIDGTRGDAVHAAWNGTVKEVFPADPMEPGEVWIEHGEWTTVYKNLEDIVVKPGQSVGVGQKLGELAGDYYEAYAGDFLEFQLWGPQGLPIDPHDYIGVQAVGSSNPNEER